MREMTKRHEQILRSPIGEVDADSLAERGEYTVVVEGASTPAAVSAETLDHFLSCLLAEGVAVRTVADLGARQSRGGASCCLPQGAGTVEQNLGSCGSEGQGKRVRYLSHIETTPPGPSAWRSQRPHLISRVFSWFIPSKKF